MLISVLSWSILFSSFFPFFSHADELNVHFHPEGSQPITYMFERRQKLDLNYITWFGVLLKVTFFKFQYNIFGLGATKCAIISGGTVLAFLTATG